MQSPSENIILDKAVAEANEARIRLLTAADISQAMRLKEQAGWNQTENDWLRLLEFEPDGCFAAEIGNKLVGTATTTTYGQKLAWIGMVLVDREFRRRKIGTRLMNAALDYLDRLNVKTVKLDATKEGAYVYENLGFEAESIIERWSGITLKTSASNHSAPSISNLSELYEFDSICFGADRSKLIEKLVENACFAPVVKTAGDGRINGYALIRQGANADYLGPVIAEDQKIAEILLDEALATIASEPVYVDVNTQFKSFEQILAARGFTKQRELVRMRRGEKNNAATSNAVFAIAGLEIG
jgi:GNAT superfamily N-acetyltransferase